MAVAKATAEITILGACLSAALDHLYSKWNIIMLKQIFNRAP